MKLFRFVVIVFLFQAEDGIRDWSVTGVQTCALPICWKRSFFASLRLCVRPDPVTPGSIQMKNLFQHQETLVGPLVADRFEVLLHLRLPACIEIGRASCGKECRSRWSPYH